MGDASLTNWQFFLEYSNILHEIICHIAVKPMYTTTKIIIVSFTTKWQRKF